MSLQGHVRFDRLRDPRAVACGILGLAFATALVGLVDPGTTSARTILPRLVDDARTALAKPPAPPAMLYKQLSPEQAVAFNAALPFTTEPNVPAKPFKLDRRSADYDRSLDCLTAAVYYEAAGEGPVGEAAVAQVVLNRVRHPAFPASICAVVYQGSTRPTGCQFSFTCDGSLLRDPDARGWKAAQAVAAAALSGSVFAPAGLATHYHTNMVVPYWASTLAKNAQVGAHIFYRWPGTWGRPPAFRQHFAGEPWQEGQLRNAALIAHGHAPRLDVGPPIAVALKAGTAAKPDPLSIVSMLATGAATDGKVQAVRASFKTEPPVVEAFRNFVSTHPDVDPATIAAAATPQEGQSDPIAAQLASSLRSFAKSSDFATFVKRTNAAPPERKQFSDALVSALRDIQAYSGVSIGTVPVTFPTVLANGTMSCTAQAADSPSRAGRQGRLPVAGRQDPLGARLGQAAADYLLWAAAADGKDGPGARAGCSSAVDQQVVAAMVIRMTALKSGPAAAERRIAWEVRHGHSLVPVIVQRLRAFEASRDRFVTLSDAYAALISGLAARPAQPPASPIAQATTPPHPVATVASLGAPARTGS